MPSKIETIAAEAYTISESGKKIIDVKVGACRATCTTPKWGLLKDIDEPLAIDVEFQEYKGKDAPKWGHRMGRIAVVNTRGQTIYDVYVQYDWDKDMSTKMPPPEFGVTRPDLWLRNGAKESREVEQNLRELFYGRLIIMHDMRLDYKAVGDVWTSRHKSGELIYDTQNTYGRVALSTLASQYLSGDNFNFHDPTEDAKVAMLLYLRRNPFKARDGFEDPPFKFEAEEFPSLK